MAEETTPGLDTNNCCAECTCLNFHSSVPPDEIED